MEDRRSVGANSCNSGDGTDQRAQSLMFMMMMTNLRKVMSRDQNAGRIHSVTIDNSTFEKVEEFKYLGTTLTDQNSIVEEIKSRLRSGNACYHSVQNLLPSILLSENLKIKMYRHTEYNFACCFVWV